MFDYLSLILLRAMSGRVPIDVRLGSCTGLDMVARRLGFGLLWTVGSACIIILLLCERRRAECFLWDSRARDRGTPAVWRGLIREDYVEYNSILWYKSLRTSTLEADCMKT